VDEAFLTHVTEYQNNVDEAFFGALMRRQTKCIEGIKKKENVVEASQKNANEVKKNLHKAKNCRHHI